MELEIEKLTFGGWGIGRTGGKVVFVKGGLPGEVLNIEITNEKRKYAEAEIRNIIKPSPERIQPPCPVFDRCGGCQWQHLKYSSQLRSKEDILRETLERIGGLKEIEVEPIVPSPKQYGYRIRVTLSVWLEKRKYRVGYFEEKSLRQVAIEHCPIASEPVNRAISRLSKSLSSIKDPYYDLEAVYISSDGSTAHVSLVPGRMKENQGKLDSFCNRLGKLMTTESISIVGDNENEFEFNLLGLRFYLTPSLFVQAHKEINERLIKDVIEWAELGGGERVLDLYSGIGNFSLHLAKSSREVIGVEVNEKAVRLAKKSAEANLIGNAFFKALPCELFVEEALVKDERFDLVVLDPPREGAKAIIPNLVQLSPEKIIYVSCDPPTLSRDLKMLRELNYRTIKIRPFDMFPQTYHIESVALLVKR
ncbi:MAG TPA: class I SAM-dependent RNA methyltransferase [Thermodesulfobacteriota bacterium]|nr:class I SAM-dependent RNA methyltransferase [Thermodesulfobacteriota bacterium]